MATLDIPRTRPVWLVGVLAGITAAAATELYGLTARVAGIPMAAGGIGAATAGPITVGMFAMGTLICTFWGTILAMLLARYASRPTRTYARTAVVLTVISLAGPLAAGATATSTKLMLAFAHLIAAAVVIPLVSLSLRQAGPGRGGRASQARS
jgi:heme A synthase